MTTESAGDALERRYMAKFQERAAPYGVVARYDRDRAARDIGLHFFRRSRSGSERATGSLVWFQMKGIQAITLSGYAFKEARSIPVTVRVKDLQLWYRMNGPTYLVVYIESVDEFLVIDIVKWATEKYGAGLLALRQKTINVPVSPESKLDSQALDLIARRGTAEEWGRILGADGRDVGLAQRDYQLIWRLATAGERQVEHKVVIRDWQSKLRGEVEFHEKPVADDDGKWRAVRAHWQLGLRASELEAAYPYVAFGPLDEEEQSNIEFSDNEDGNPEVEFSDGSSVYGHDCSGEYHVYEPT